MTPEYFGLLEIPVLRGRLFNEGDDEKAPQVAVINQAMARTYWRDETAIGKRLRRDRPGSPWITVVGVVADARTESLANASVPQIYLSLYQTPTADGHLSAWRLNATARFRKGCARWCSR